MRRAVAALLVLLLSAQALAEDKDVEALMSGQEAPWSGLLVRETRFAAMLKLQVTVDELTYKLQLREKLYTDATEILKQQLVAAQTELNKRAGPGPWYKNPWFLICVGIAVGIGISVGAAYAAAQLK